MRPISNVVDVTNYVMLGLGNPLHAFDYAKLRGGKIIVRRAHVGERLRTLDGVERELEPYDLMIADGERSVALAGIMGGEETEIGADTTEILLEAANFEPYTTFRTAERLRLRTEGSNRWEKGVDPYLAEQAAKLATQLIVEHAGASWAGHADVHAELPQPPVVRLRPERTDAVVGIETPSAEQNAILRRLEFGVDGENVSVPTWRARDVTREIDVVEEVARFRLADVPGRLPTRQAMFGQLSKHQRIRRRIEDVLVGFGYSEAYTWSLCRRSRRRRCPAAGASRASRLFSGRRSSKACSRRRGATSMPATTTSRSSSRHTSTSRPAKSCPRNAGASGDRARRVRVRQGHGRRPLCGPWHRAELQSGR
jgi:phenylalanyl-tRNA synthetase beta chain